MSDLPSAELVELVPLRLAVADHDDLVLAGHREAVGSQEQILRILREESEWDCARLRFRNSTFIRPYLSENVWQQTELLADLSKPLESSEGNAGDLGISEYQKPKSDSYPSLPIPTKPDCLAYHQAR